METANSTADNTPVGPVGEKEIRVLVVDDHEVVREGLRVIFQEESDISLVGEASSSAECLNSLSRLKPDVILMDIKMPDGDGFQALKKIREKNPEIRVIMLTGFGGVMKDKGDIPASVDIVQSKPISREELSHAINQLMAGRT